VVILATYMKPVRFIRAPEDLSRPLKGLYGRVARRLGVHPSYVSGVARGEFYSKGVEDALLQELSNLVERVNKRNRLGQKASSKRAQGTKGTKQRKNKNEVGERSQPKLRRLG
jgi:hypothetical protein